MGQRCEIPVPGEICFFFRQISCRFTDKLLVFSFLDPCQGKDCGPFGECHDVKGSGVCKCHDGLHLDGSPCPGRDSTLIENRYIFFSIAI